MNESSSKFFSKSQLIMIAVFSVIVVGAVFMGYRLGRMNVPESGRVETSGLKVVLIGVDGAEWAIINPLMEAGKLPTFSRLIREGASGTLKSLEPILSPIIWTTIVTGKSPDKHGITWFMVKDPEQSRRFPVQSTMRQCKAIWNILSDRGLTVGSIGWWASYPAERVNGFVVTDYIAYHAFGLSAKGVKSSVGKTFPASLYEQVTSSLRDPLSVPKSDVDRFMSVTDEEYEFSAQQDFDFGNPLQHFMYAYSTGTAYRDMGLKLYQQYQPDYMGIYFEQVDTLSHLYMKYTEPKMEGLADEFYEKYKDVIPNYYIYQDQIIADFLETIDKDTVVIICSDHGFKTGDKRLAENVATSVAKAHLWHEIMGVVVMWGGPIEKGVEMEGASVLDITPTILYLLGQPVARDMDGKVLYDAISKDFRKKHPLRFIETYETAGEVAKTPAPTTDNSGVDPEIIARLEALGYIGGALQDKEIRINRVKAHLDQGNLDKAAEEAQAVLAQDPEDLMARIMLARILEKKGNVEDAEARFREIAGEVDEIDGAGEPVPPKKRMAYAEALQAVSVYDHMAGKTDEAIQGLERSLELNPNDPNGEYNLGVMLEAKDDCASAVGHYQKAIELNPDHALSHNNLGNCYQKQGEIQKAIAEYKKTAEIDSRHMECHFNLAVLYRSLGRTKDARTEFEAALKINPGFNQASVALGDLALQEKDYETAVSRFDALVESGPANPEYLFLSGKAYALMGDIQKARERINAAKRIDPQGVGRALSMDARLKELVDGK